MATLLVVDDSASIRSFVRQALKPGFVVLEAADAEAASAILEKNRVDVLLVDQWMPGVKGLDFLMQAAEERPGMARILMSAKLQDDDALMAVEQGHVHQCVLKPLEREALRRLVSEALQTARASGDGDWSLTRGDGQ